MRIIIILLVFCIWAAAGDGSHFKAKAKILARLVASKRPQRGLSAVPPYKLGYDFPRVTHSLVKPVVVTYPPTAAVSAVKVPLVHPLLPKYPVPVGHRVPVPHPHYGLRFPHHQHKAVVIPKPDQHFHHHHHHVSPRPVVPVVPAPVPVAPAVVRPLPAPPLVLPTQVVQPALPAPLHLKPVLPAPAAPVFNFPQYAPQIPYVLRPGGAVQTSLFANYPRFPFLNYQGPVFPLHSSTFSQIVPHAQPPQYYGGGEAHDGVVVERPAVQLAPASGLVPAAQPGVHVHVEQPDIHLQPVPQPEVHLHAAQPDIHLHPGVQVAQPDLHLHPGVQVQQPELQLHPGVQVAQPDIHFHTGQPSVQTQPGQQEVHFHTGQAGVLQPGIQIHPGHPDLQFHAGQPGVHIHPGQPDVHYQGGQPDIHLQPGVQLNGGGQQDGFQQPGFAYQPGQLDYPGFHNQLQPAQPTVDHNGWAPVPPQNDFGFPNGQYPDDGQHQFSQDQGHHQFSQDQGHNQLGQDQGHNQFGQGHDQGHPGYDQNAQDQYDYQNQLQHHIQQQLDQAQFEQSLHNHQLSEEYGPPSHGDYPQSHQPAAEYGQPQGAEGRSAEGQTDEPEGTSQQFHNHIPLGLQPPIDRPLEHFR